MPSPPKNTPVFVVNQPSAVLPVIVVDGTVEVTNFPVTQEVTGSFYPASQPVTGNFFPAVQPVSGTFFPAVQPVSGTFFPPVQPVSGSVTATVVFPLTQAVTGTFWQAVQPVSGTFWQATQPVAQVGSTYTHVAGVIVTTPIKLGAGVLRKIIVGTATQAGTIVLADSLATALPVICKLTNQANAPAYALDVNLKFLTGLTVTPSSVAYDITLVWD